jgi:hypothetical protein
MTTPDEVREQASDSFFDAHNKYSDDYPSARSAFKAAYSSRDAEVAALKAEVAALKAVIEKAKKHAMTREQDTDTLPLDLGCTMPPAGWWCSIEPGHDGPCAAREK